MEAKFSSIPEVKKDKFNASLILQIVITTLIAMFVTKWFNLRVMKKNG